ASFTGCETVRAYTDLGHTLLDELQITKVLDEELNDDDSRILEDRFKLSETIHKVRDIAIERGFPEDDPTFNDTWLTRVARRVFSEQKAAYVSRVEDIVEVAVRNFKA